MPNLAAQPALVELTCSIGAPPRAVCMTTCGSDGAMAVSVDFTITRTRTREGIPKPLIRFDFLEAERVLLRRELSCEITEEDRDEVDLGSILSLHPKH